eukprot:2899277-Prymnesium_polylepis.1
MAMWFLNKPPRLRRGGAAAQPRLDERSEEPGVQEGAARRTRGHWRAPPSASKYFEHAGALLTADGSGDDLIKLEGVPRGETFTWEDDEPGLVEVE